MIAEVLTALVAIQEGLHITSPIVAGVTKAYRGIPSPQFALPGPRVWQNEFTMGQTDITREHGLIVSVHMQFLAAEASNGDDQQTYAIATAFWEALMEVLYPVSTLEALTAAQRLVGGMGHSMRGGSPTISLATRGNLLYVMADGYLDVEVPFGVAADA